MRAAGMRRARGIGSASGASSSMAWLMLVMVFVLAAPNVRPQHIKLAIDDVAGAGFAANGIAVDFAGGGAASIDIGVLTFGDRSWKNIRLHCARLVVERARMDCDDGVLASGEKIPLAFRYLTDKRVFDIEFKPAADERWKFHLQPGKRANDVSLTLENARLQRLAGWLPKDVPKIQTGVANGVVQYRGDGQLSLKLAASGVGFSDAGGLRAGEKVGAVVDANVTFLADVVRWNGTVAWHEGEVFWQPLYFKAAKQQVSAEGRMENQVLYVERGALRYIGIGELAFHGTYDLAAGKAATAQASMRDISAAALYESVLKPFLQGTAFADLRADGRVSMELQLGAQGLQRADVHLDQVSFEDLTQRRFALFGVTGAVPWRADAATQAAVNIKGGEVFKMPLGAFSMPLEMHGARFRLKQLRVPLFDGHVELRDFTAAADATGWTWQFNGAASGISMDRLTAALGLPVMHGTLGAVLPMVRHETSTLRADGALSLKVFDGTIEAKNLVLLDPFGRAPRLQTDMAMRNLDLELVTRTYSFGNITGRVDANVAELELVNWQPVKFDARIASSSGEYPRKISQTAVQNISALGGAGAAAAIQRSLLRFFDQFGYSRLGWSCKLQNGVCEMGGVEDAPQGYVIVKGGGIPAITVMGYNRQVSWRELLDRLKRVTQGNVTPVVQ